MLVQSEECSRQLAALCVCEYADVTMKCFEVCPGDQISKEAFLCILALCYVYVMLLFGWLWLFYSHNRVLLAVGTRRTGSATSSQCTRSSTPQKGSYNFVLLLMLLFTD